jgi:ABC-type nitrate/sulfonate/bicarbonate transport system substrate-binding protein
MKLAIPDLISPSYFPAVAAIELGCFKDEGLDVALEMIFPVDKCAAALRDGAIDFFAGSAHTMLSAFPRFAGGKLLCAQSQGMYWFLVMRRDLAPTRGDLSIAKGRTIGAAPWVEMGLRGMLYAAGIDPVRDNVSIVPVPGAIAGVPNFGVMAAQATAAGKLDGFWANGMGTELSVRDGVGAVVVDARRGDGPKGSFHYTQAIVAATDRLIAQNPGAAAGAVRAIRRAHAILKADPSRATAVGKKLFPPAEAELIAELVRRDAPFYDATISRDFVAGMTAFARSLGILDAELPYESVVAAQLSSLWTA